VTNVVIVLVPTTKGIEELADPDATVNPFTFTVAVVSVMVGVTVIDAVAFVTFAE